MNIVVSRECQVKTNDLVAFATKEFLKAKGQDYGYIYGLDNDNNIVFYIAFILKKKLTFCLAEFQTSVVCLDEGRLEEKKIFLNNAIKLLGEVHNVDFICQNPAYAIFDYYPENAIYTYFGSYICDLTNTEDELWKGVHSKHRNVIRKAIKNGIEIKINETPIEQIYEIIKKTQERSCHAFITIEKFEAMKKGLADKMDFIAAYQGDILQGCAVIVHDKKSAYYLFGGSCTKTFPGALNLLHWQAMLHYKENGLTKYDFVGARLSDHISAKLHGIQRFKERFGGNLQKGLLWKYIYKPHKYMIYKFINFIRTHRWEVDAIDEEHITDI